MNITTLRQIQLRMAAEGVISAPFLPDDELWTTGDPDYEVLLKQQAASGSLKLYSHETAGSLKQDLSAGAFKLGKADLTRDVTLWVEGAAVTDIEWLQV